MKVELKRISQNKRLSEETVCYSADLYLDGVKSGTVSNYGHGGPDMQHLRPGLDIRAIDAAIARTYPPLDLGEDHGTIPATLEIVCHDIVAKHEALKAFRRLCGRKVVGVRDGKDYAFNVAPSFLDVQSPSSGRTGREILLAKYPGMVILNGLSDEQILAVIG